MTLSKPDRPADQTAVSVIIPHYLGNVVCACLRTVYAHSQGVPFEVILVDDGPGNDGSVARALAEFPRTCVVRTRGGVGFGGACNAGAALARGRYLVILNNDVEVDCNWLSSLVRAADADRTIGVLQSKLRSLSSRNQFDYSGAAGGLMDRFGYPFAMGRVFDTVEVDRGQYDSPREIFWAVGSAMLVRREAFERVGGFDEAFYMHMEEMDLCWRIRRAGYTVWSCPSSVVFHHGGFTLKPKSFEKAYLNHRNNLVLLIKNLPARRLAWILPLRLFMEAATVIYGFVRRDWRRPLAAIAGAAWVAVHLPSVLRRRSAHWTSAPTAVGPVYDGSIVVDYFLRRRRYASDVMTLDAGISARPVTAGADRLHPAATVAPAAG